MGLDIKYVKPHLLSIDEKQTMFELMKKYYENMTYSKFDDDFKSKDDVILLMDKQKICGFTTIELMPLTIENKPVLGVFSGNTIVDQTYPIGLELQHGFVGYIHDLMTQVKDQEIYWFLICKGYKTYRYLSIYFDTFYPNPKGSTPAFEKEIMDTYARAKYQDAYNPKTGIIKNSGFNDYLKSDVAPMNEKARRKPAARFFEEKNPGHIQGDELVCLARFSQSNLKKAFFRITNR